MRATPRDADTAIADFDETIRRDPRFALAYGARCDMWIGKRQFDRALADCTEAIRLDATKAVYFNDRGVAFFGNGDLDRALADYNEALRLDPRHVRSYGNRCAVCRVRATWTVPGACYRKAVMAVSRSPVWRPRI
jgi:tetratricopeptide (TPR) repeat protein